MNLRTVTGRFLGFSVLAFAMLASSTTETQAAPGDDAPRQATSRAFAKISVPIAGVAAGEDVVFVGEPLQGSVVVLARSDARPIGMLPPPPDGFALPFIIHSLGEGRVAVLDAGGLPQPSPFKPANPSIYEYAYRFSSERGFSARLTRSISFASVPVGFSEDFVRLDDGRFLLSDAILGSIWIAESNGTISPGIVPQSFNPPDLIPSLAFCPGMPEISVDGVPFLFSGSTLPGVSPMAVRDGTVYYYSPCARGIYAFPVATLSDNRLPFQRAADIHLVAPTPSNVLVEELLDFSFNPFDRSDKFLYAADPLKLRVIAIDLTNGRRHVVADDPKLLDFPSSLGFLPPHGEKSELLVVSNQQERTPLTNDAVTQTMFNLPFMIARVSLPTERWAD